MDKNDIEQIINSRKLEQYNTYITNLEELITSVKINGTYEQYRLAPCLMLFNFIDLLRSVCILDTNHMVSASKIVTRSMFEILLDYLYCETDRKKLYRRFGEYQNVNRVLLYKTIPDDLKKQVNQDDFNNITLPKYKEFLKRYKINKKDKNYRKKISNWSGYSISQRVSIVSQQIPEINDLYLNIYKVNCDYTHTYASTLCEYATLENNTIHINYSNQYNKNNFSIIKEINSLVDIFYNNFKENYYNKYLKDIIF